MSDAFGQVEQTLEKKAGPLPVWAWGAVAAGLIYVLFYRRMKAAAADQAAAATPAPTQDETVDPTDQSGGGDNGLFDPSAPIGDWLGDNPQSGAYPVGKNPNGLPAPISNAQWARLVSDKLLGLGDDPALVSSALAKYLIGRPLTAAEQAIINQGLTFFGTPPEGPIASTPAPPVVKPPVKPPVKPGPTATVFADQEHYMGKAGETVRFKSYIRAIYPGATEQQVSNIAYWTAKDPRNKAGQFYFIADKVPGTYHVYFKGSQANNSKR